MKRAKYIVLLACSFFLSCHKENAFDCFKGNGSEVTQLRQPGQFTYIEIYDKMEVTLFHGTEYKVEVTAGEKIMRNIATTVSGNILKIENKNTCNFVRGYKRTIKVKVTLPYLKLVTNNSVGPVIFDPGFTQDTLLIRAESSGDFHVNGTFNEIRTSSHGNGDVYLAGKCSTLYVYANGTNYLFAQDLKVTDYAFIHNVSYGDCHVNATGLNQLAYNIQRDGNIYYSGDPKVITNFGDGTGKGQLIRE
jgi:hypothetical protein